MKLQSRIDRETLGMDEGEADAWEVATEREFRFAGVQNLVFRSAFESGNVFILMPHIERSAFHYGLKLQVRKADGLQISTTCATEQCIPEALKRIGMAYSEPSLGQIHEVIEEGIVAHRGVKSGLFEDGITDCVPCQSDNVLL